MRLYIISIILVSLCFNSEVLANTSDEIDEFKHSWTAKALALQRQIDIDAPFNHATFIGTHNSYNSESYKIPLIRYVDPSHTLSVYEQLEMGVRSVEFDAHWYLGRRAKKEILLCHGQPNHIGCSVFDRPFVEGLQELQNWLKANPGEVVLLYIEKHLDGHESQLATELDQYLGSIIFKPSVIRKSGRDANTCVAIPQTLTKRDVLQAGKQLLIVTKECSSLANADQDHFNYNVNDYVFAGIGNIPSSLFTFLDSTIGDDFKPYPDCSTDIFNADPEHTSSWRIFEDRTKLSNVGNPKRKLLAEDMKELLRCHINWPTMDMLSVDDARLSAAVWSWTPSFPIEGQGQCAIYKNGEGIQNVPCTQSMSGYTCEQEGTYFFAAISAAGTWQEGEAMCQVFAGKDWHFSMPVNGSQMHALKISVENKLLPEVWLNYRQEQVSKKWVVPR